MPSGEHEILIELFRRRPTLAAELLTRAFGIAVPAHRQARVEPGDFSDLAPAQYQADTVVALTDGARHVLAVVVEVQRRPRPAKRWSWPLYVAALRARLRCPTTLLVVCTDRATAAWCATPIDLGHPGMTMVPLVLGPDQVPVVTDPAEAARAPEPVLSALAHGARPDRTDVLDALLAALGSVDLDRVSLYSDLVLAALPQAARHYLEALVKTGTYEYQSDFVRRYIFQGRAEGEAKGEAKGRATAVLAVLEARGLDVPDPARTRITECTDLDQLDVWVRRAVTVASAEDLLG